MNNIDPELALEVIGENPVRLWGLTMAERHRRIAGANGWRLSSGSDAPAVLVDAQVVADPAWLTYIAGQPGLVLTLGGIPALAYARAVDEAAAVRAAMLRRLPLPDDGVMEVIAFESGPTIEDRRLRKRETPFLLPLLNDTVREVETASYFGAYKGVTDLLTKYLWPNVALVLTRVAAKLGMTPNQITLIGAFLCVAATFAFAGGYYWTGLAMGLVFMVLDTVDGKLARCTVTSTWWGNVFDHGIDLIHPPFWWWFWATGLVHWGLELDASTFWIVQGVLIGGYVLQRAIEGIFMRQNGMLHIHVWERFDSQFRLITARRNPNVAILFVSLLFGRPDMGIVAVAAWTLISLVVHAVRLAQAWIHRTRGGQITSWLTEGSA